MEGASRGVGNGSAGSGSVGSGSVIGSGDVGNGGVASGRIGNGSAGKSGAGKSGAGKSGAGKSGAGKSGAGKSGAGASGCVVIRTGGSYDGKQGLSLSTGVSEASAGSRALCLHVITIPAGTRGTPHLHDGHETAIWIAGGEVEVWHGPGLIGRTSLRAGDFLYVPPGAPHLPVNKSGTDAIAVIARTDPAEQESVVVLDLPPHLHDLAALPVAAG